MDASGAEERPLDVLTIGEMVVDFISYEKTDTLSNAATFRRYLGAPRQTSPSTPVVGSDACRVRGGL